MLERLIVRNYAVVEDVEVRFAPGLNVLTGETGAGKSVLIDALGLVLGGRADASVVRDGAKEAEVEADFGGTVLRRTVTAQGRSRAWIGDESVSVTELRDFGRGRVDIHGPTASQRMLEEGFQREAVDAYGSISRDEYSKAFARRSAILAELKSLVDGETQSDVAELLRYQVDELSGAELSEDDDTLAERHAAAARAEELVREATDITEALGGDESVSSILAALQPRLRSLARRIPEAAEWADRAAGLAEGVDALSRSIADAAGRADFGEEDLEALDARLSLVSRLRRKYLPHLGANEPCFAALTEVLEEKRRKLDAIEHREEREAELRRELESADAEVRKAGAELGKKRRAAATRLAERVTRNLHGLGFLSASFDIRIEDCEPAEHGCDRVTYMFGPNPGESERPLADIASSGEIARVMLALKSVLAAHDRTEVIVFDEIDANIGGETGRAVGERLREVARRRQVIAITHLPQSAAYGDRHLVVSKAVSGGRTRTTIAEVAGDRRVNEIARMLGGERPTGVVGKHAEELLRISRGDGG